MADKKVAVLVDSEFGLTEQEARELGFYFVPVQIEWNGQQMLSGVDATLGFLYENLTVDVDFKTSTPSPGMIAQEYEKAFADGYDEIFVICLSKHLSGTYNTFSLVGEDYPGKVTVYDSELIGAWNIIHKEILSQMVKENAQMEEYIKLYDAQRGHMKAWLFPKSLDRVYASGRLSKAQYMAGSLLKVTPVMPIDNGRINNHEVIKTRSPEKAIKVIVEKVMEQYNENISNGIDCYIAFASLGDPETNMYTPVLKEAFKEVGIDEVALTWLPPAVVGHVGTGGIGAGLIVKHPKEYKK